MRSPTRNLYLSSGTYALRSVAVLRGPLVGVGNDDARSRKDKPTPVTPTGEAEPAPSGVSCAGLATMTAKKRKRPMAPLSHVCLINRPLLDPKRQPAPH